MRQLGKLTGLMQVGKTYKIVGHYKNEVEEYYYKYYNNMVFMCGIICVAFAKFIVQTFWWGGYLVKY